MKQDSQSTHSVRVFDRVLKQPVPHIATEHDKFILENGYYVNETETVVIQSSNETGKYFKKISPEI